MERKLSSAIIISAVSRAMSVPLPIATPILAALRAGASLTPSPVTATNSPWRLSDSMISSFCSGVTRAKTVFSAIKASKCFLPRFEASATSSPLAIALASLARPRSLAIESAVSGWSPVTIKTLIPASWHWRIDETASLRIGSIKPTRPVKVRFLISFGVKSERFLPSSLPFASAITR